MLPRLSSHFLKPHYFLFIFLLTVTGCFGGQTITNNVDFLIYPAPGAGSGEFKITGESNPITLNIGDKVEIANNIPQAPEMQTCLYAYFALGGIILKSGYDPGATVQGGGPRYPDAVINLTSQIPPYEVKVIKTDNTQHTYTLPAGESGAIFSNSFPKFAIRSPTGEVGADIDIAGAFAQGLGTDAQRGTALDRTICFTGENDPVVFEVAVMPGSMTVATINDNQVPVDHDPIQEPTPEDINKIKGTPSTPIGGPSASSGRSGDTTPVAATENKAGGGGGGCPMQLDPTSHTSSTAWVWVTCLCVTGMAIGRRKFLANR